MNQQFPIYTVAAECQDCYKCVRVCPVKAIRIEDGRASVVPDLCVLCGRCVSVCPAQAKKIRDDLGRARRLIGDERKVVASLAPSWVSEFPSATTEQMIAVLHRLGFAAVGETALGAQEVSAAIAASLEHSPNGLMISSACPSAVSAIQKYEPQLAETITQVSSPVLAHARLLRREYGDGIAVVFIGPCIAKKREADTHPELLDLALTFGELRRWMEVEAVTFDNVKPDDACRFVPEPAEEGVVYPVEGGMVQTIQAYHPPREAEFVTLAGMANILEALGGLQPDDINRPVLVECLACEGGCTNGPGSTRRRGRLRGHLAVLDRTRRS